MTNMTWILTLIISIPLGIGVPTQTSDPDEFIAQNLGVPWYNWSDTSCHDPNFTPMIWKAIPGQELPANCQNGKVYVGNECHSTFQCNTEPEQIRTLIYELDEKYSGLEIYCCGGVYAAGYLELLQVLEPGLPLDGIHFHIYVEDKNVAIQRGLWKAWKDIAKQEELPIVITEFACLSHSKASVVECMPYVLMKLITYFQPEVVYWFSWRYPGYESTDLSNDDNTLTEVGDAWQALEITQVYLPILLVALTAD